MKKAKSWEEITKAFNALYHMSCKPAGISKVRPCHVFDEEQSVKWNKMRAEQK